MNQELSNIELLIQQSALTEDEKQKLLKEIGNANKKWNILEFKLDRTEKVKKTTSVLLEETIEELEKKRKDVEAQNKELEIQNALERVRSVALGMKEPADMLEICRTISNQLELLHVKEIRNVQTAIFYESKDTYMNYEYYAKHDKTFITETSFTNHQMHQEFAAQMLKGKGEFFTTYISKAELPDWIAYQKTTNVFIDTYLETSTSLTYYWYSLGPVALGISTYKPLNEEEANLFKRFLKVFELSYTRYLDIEQAIAQARESQIQLALERVRARTMAMQKSDELAEVATLLFKQVNDLGIKTWTTGFNIWSDGNNAYEDWIASPGGGFIQPYVIDATAFSEFKALSDAKKSGTDFFILYQEGEILKETYKQLSHFANKSQFEKILDEGFQFPSKQYVHMVFGSKVSLMFITYEPVPEAHDIFKRFGKVFEQTYTRFLDLQKAEAQTREAKIEVALERVRAKAMAMQNSNDLSATASMVFTELRKLGINPIRCGVGLLSKETRKAQLYFATSSSNGDSLSLIGWVILSGHPVLEHIYDTWLNNEDYFPELTGKQLQSYYENLLAGLSLPTVPDWHTGEKQYGHFFSFSIGCLYAWSQTAYNESEIKILKRFASIIDLTFRRYIELQTAELNAKEAAKQSALDRIRADIASMRTVNDLDRITPLIWNELTILGIPFIRCGVFIMNDEQQLIHTFLSTPDGKAIAAFQIPYNAPGNIKHVIEYWHNNKNYIDHWDENEFTEFAEMLAEQGALESAKQYLKTIPHGGFYLHFLPFLQGMLYVGNINQLSNDEIDLIQSVADAFSTAYARYEDFNKLEAAKQQVDKTLVELKQTQQQLVQSEKMASLGELTAGIAHEIQNPLNFVNNFSEVSNELIEELKIKNQELKIEDKEVNELLNDIKQNLEKINHHGKRADAIVKNMLQHSRKNSGVKEPTDINALCDEYLRLSFHGMRAKDKSFNADFKTDFDETIGKINIVPQDIGRVLLNLFNNAFYATSEKLKAKSLTQNAEYKPLVSIQTKRINDKIEIIVSDNGNGISQNIIDKIFQPFFTTKPTGEGTGLGLSLAYDIITKEHNGTIKVESKEGDGSTFVIKLPTN